jgi:sec-independent protein translocase protein TatB
MFDVGYSELLVIAVVLIVVVGPKDLPKMLRAFGKTMTRVRQMSGEFRKQFDDALKEVELDEVRKTIDVARSLDPRQQIRDAFNPLRSAVDGVKRDIAKPPITSNPTLAAAPAMVPSPKTEPKVEEIAKKPTAPRKPKVEAAIVPVKPVKAVTSKPVAARAALANATPVKAPAKRGKAAAK